MAALEIRPVVADQLDAVRQLFRGNRATRHCWCMAFCSTRALFALGWYGGGNQHRFEAMATSSRTPMGVLAVSDGEPVGWCACGPRSRYVAGAAGRSSLLAHRPRHEDDHVWLVPCIYVRPAHRSAHVVIPMLRGAVSLAHEWGASAVESWPLAAGVRRPQSLHLGTERVFAGLGFHVVAKPTEDRVFMRLDLTGGSSDSCLGADP